MERLKTSADFQRLSRSGKRWVGPAFIMQTVRTEAGSPFQLGLTASRKVGNAVTRNRAKRRLREAVRTWPGLSHLSALDVVLIAKTAAATCDFLVLQNDFERGLAAAGITS